jgi:DNA-binding Xre family transcriptional regulator
MAPVTVALPPRRGPGRPRALNINPVAVLDMAQQRLMRVEDLAKAAGISVSHLSEAINRAKGLSLPAIDRLATVLRCKPETIAPTMTNLFIACRPGDAA